MKTLILIRHAKSSWKESLPDLARPLNKRGQRDAPMMGERLARQEVEPDLIVSSPATRALTTAKIVAQEIGYTEQDILADERLYDASVFDLLEIVRELDDRLSCVMLFGHNPGFTELANELGCDVDNVPTCGIVTLRFDIDSWAHVGESEPVQADLDYPKQAE